MPKQESTKIILWLAGVIVTACAMIYASISSSCEKNSIDIDVLRDRALASDAELRELHNRDMREFMTEQAIIRTDVGYIRALLEDHVKASERLTVER